MIIRFNLASQFTSNCIFVNEYDPLYTVLICPFDSYVAGSNCAHLAALKYTLAMGRELSRLMAGCVYFSSFPK